MRTFQYCVSITKITYNNPYSNIDIGVGDLYIAQETIIPDDRPYSLGDEATFKYYQVKNGILVDTVLVTGIILLSQEKGYDNIPVTIQMEH